MGVVELGEGEASRDARRAKRHERCGDERVAHARNLLHERLDVAVAGIIGRGEEDGEDEDAHQRLVLEQHGQLLDRELAA